MQLPQHLFPGLFLVMALGEALARVLRRHLDQMPFVTALGTQNRHLLAFLIGEIFFPHAGILQRHGQENLIGNKALPLVKLREQRGYDFFVGKLEVFDGIGLITGQLSLAHEQHLRLDEAALAIDSEDVLVAAPVGDHSLLFERLLHRLDLITDLRRCFVF